VEWTVYNFECADAEACESLVDWFDETHWLDVPEDEDYVHGTLVDADDAERKVDLAWVAEYGYLLSNDRVPGLLDASADRWERAVVATFDSETETCIEAVFYRSDEGRPAETARYEGVPDLSGQGLLYRFAMAHQFRFRAYAHAPPAPMVTPAFGAFDAVVGMGWGSEEMEDLEADTGVTPTAEGLVFLESDPVLDEGEFYEAAEE
jgi:hypothetical protein